MNRKQRFAQNMLKLSNKSQARNTAFYCEQAYPYLYSAIAIVLHDKFGFGYQRLEKLFHETNIVWEEYAENGTEEELSTICFERTGIAIMNQQQAIEQGLMGKPYQE